MDDLLKARLGNGEVRRGGTPFCKTPGEGQTPALIALMLAMSTGV